MTLPRTRFKPLALAVALTLLGVRGLSASVPSEVKAYIGSRIAAVQVALLSVYGPPSSGAPQQRVLIAQGFNDEILIKFPSLPKSGTGTVELIACVRAEIARNPMMNVMAGVPFESAYPADDATLLAPAFVPGDPNETKLRDFATFVRAAGEGRAKGLIPMDEEYWIQDSAPHFHSEEARAPFRVQIREGRLWQNGLPLDKGDFNFVLSPALELFAGNLKLEHLHHSTFLAGGPVVAAGEIHVEKGLVIRISNKSGHYLPGPQTLRRFLRFLLHAGVDLTATDIAVTGSETVLKAPAFLRMEDQDLLVLRKEILPSGDAGRLRAYLDSQPLPADIPFVLPDGSQETLLHMACDALFGPEALRLLMDRDAGLDRVRPRENKAFGPSGTERHLPAEGARALQGPGASGLSGRGAEEESPKKGTVAGD